MKISLESLPKYDEFSSAEYRSLISKEELLEVDIDKIQLKSFLLPGEKVISGEEKMARVWKSGYLPLDARVALALSKNWRNIPKSWIRNIYQTQVNWHRDSVFISFDGTRCSTEEWSEDLKTYVHRNWKVPCLKFEEITHVTGLCGGEITQEVWNYERFGLGIEGVAYSQCLSAVYEK